MDIVFDRETRTVRLASVAVIENPGNWVVGDLLLYSIDSSDTVTSSGVVDEFAWNPRLSENGDFVAYFTLGITGQAAKDSVGHVLEWNSPYTEVVSRTGASFDSVTNLGEGIGVDYFDPRLPQGFGVAMFSSSGIDRLSIPGGYGQYDRVYARGISHDGSYVIGNADDFEVIGGALELVDPRGVVFGPDGNIVLTIHDARMLDISRNATFVSGYVGSEGIVWERTGEHQFDEYVRHKNSSGQASIVFQVLDSGFMSNNSDVWWPSLSEDRPELNLDFEEMVPFATAFPNAVLPDGSSITVIDADDSGRLHVAFRTANSAGYLSVLDPTVSADFDNDTDVDGADYLAWQRGFNSASSFSDGDGNLDGAVDELDLFIWKDRFGTAAGIATSVAQVPEPSRLTLFAAIASCLVFRGHRNSKKPS